jgi:hypothetical protein
MVSVQTDEVLSSLYSVRVSAPLERIPYTRPLDHTMFSALDPYVASKLPVQRIIDALVADCSIEVHGIYPDHFPKVAYDLGIAEGLVEIPFQSKPPRSSCNSVRPRFFIGCRDEPLILVAAPPGLDYVLHYASLLRHFAALYTVQSPSLVSAYHYPFAERLDWTGLDAWFVRPDDRVALGYVPTLKGFCDAAGLPLVDCAENEFYKNFVYGLPDGSRLNLLGVKFCFWGSLSERLCTLIYGLGASEITYVAKLGTLTSPNDIYSRVFSPETFYIVEHMSVMETIPPGGNHLIERFPYIATGAHASVPTVLEEDYCQRALLDSLGVNTIDNEIAKMARAAYHCQTVGKATFSAVHVATDYLRSKAERTLPVEFDLTTGRRGEVAVMKQFVLRRIFAEILLPYWTHERNVI